jgi:hypothetical protein
MTAILTTDVAGCYDVQLFDQGRSISGLQCLGPYVSQRCTLVGTSTESNIFTIKWTDEGNNYSTAINVAARRFAVYSNNVPVQ